jgi:hypothetical protein
VHPGPPRKEALCVALHRRSIVLFGRGLGKRAGRDVRDELAVVLPDLKLPTVLKEPPFAPR